MLDFPNEGGHIPSIAFSFVHISLRIAFNLHFGQHTLTSRTSHARCVENTGHMAEPHVWLSIFIASPISEMPAGFIYKSGHMQFTEIFYGRWFGKYSQRLEKMSRCPWAWICFNWDSILSFYSLMRFVRNGFFSGGILKYLHPYTETQ